METVKNRKKNGRQTSTHTAQDKVKAVLSVWTERRKPAEVCRELEIQWAILSHWQDRALEGMLQALQPRVNLEKGAALSPRLQMLLEKKQKRMEQSQVKNLKLENRLAKIQVPKEPTKVTKTAKDKAKK